MENLDAAEPSNFEHQEIQIKIEASRRERLLTPRVLAAEDREPLPMLNASSRDSQVKFEPLCTVELPDDDDILEIMTQCSLLTSEVVDISSDDEDADVGASPQRPEIIKTSSSAKRKAKRKLKTLTKSGTALIKHTSTPMSSIKKNAILNSIAKARTLSKNPAPTNEKKSITDTTKGNMSNNNHAPSTAAAPSLLPQNTVKEDSQQQQQNNNVFQQNINQLNQQLKIAVVDRGHPSGQIDRHNKNLVVNAIAECMLTTMNSNYYISPRFLNSSWRKGKFIFMCADVATRQFLIETVAHLPQLWRGCSLAAVRQNASRNTKRVRLILGSQVLICCANFLATLARQNPDLNVYEWEVVNYSFWRYDGDILLDFNIDGDSYAIMRRNRGFVYFGFGRLLFNLDEHRPMNAVTRFVKRMIYWNINSQFNVHSYNIVSR